MRCYLAGPEVFLRDSVAIGERKKAICAEQGLVGVFPLDGPPLDATDAEAIFARCVEHLEACDLLIANMTPFRGMSMDVGTAVEIGYALGQSKPVFGYTNVDVDYRDRVADDDFAVEDFGLADNLMCDGAVRQFGGTVVRTAVEGDPAAVLADLTGFRLAAAQAATWVTRTANSRQ